VALNIVMAYVGAGVLSIPYAMHRVGVALGATVVAGVATASVVAASLFVECKEAAESSRPVEMNMPMTPGDVAALAFGSRGRRTAQFVLAAAQSGLAAAYYFFGM